MIAKPTGSSLLSAALACWLGTGAALAQSPGTEHLSHSHYGSVLYQLASYPPLLPSGVVYPPDQVAGEVETQSFKPRGHSKPCPPSCAEPARPIEPLPKMDPPRPDQPPVVEPTFAPEQASASSGFYAAVPPNMIGDLASFGFSIAFNYINLVDTDVGFLNFAEQAGVQAGSFVGLNSAKAAENNCALPTNRAYFRYNYFADTNTVVGLRPGGPPHTGAFSLESDTQLAATPRSYGAHWFTFGAEKTFFRDLCSVELRVPFACNLSSNLQLSPGQGAFNAAGDLEYSNPDGTFGDYATEFGDLALILKGLVYYSNRAALACGLVVTAPTGPDSRVQIADNYFDTSELLSMRIRNFQIENETWSVSPYLAWLIQPGDRLFMQGFYQFYFPVGSNSFFYREDLLEPTAPRTIAADGQLNGQTFMMADIGIGYWLVRAAAPRRLTGLAPLLELHYATTLTDATLVTLPSDGIFNQPNASLNGSPTLPPPVIGNTRNRVDFLNLTAGLVAEFGNRLLITTGVGCPLKSADDQVFDWEIQLQVNYRFGPAPAYLRTPPL